MVTNNERQLAKRIERDRERYGRRGVTAGTRLGFQLLAGVLSAYKRGRDPVACLDRLFRQVGIMLRDGMVATHLAGLQRTLTFYKSQPKPPIHLSVYGDSIKALKVRLGFSTARIKELTELYRPEATLVLKNVETSVSKTLQRRLIDIQTKGLHVKEGIKELRSAFGKLGITPNSSHAIETVFRTQTQLAYSAGRWQADQDPVIQSILWGYKYVTVGDQRTRLSHVALDGITLPKEDPQWDTIFPPNGFNCRCTTIPIFEKRKTISPKDSVVIAGQQVRPGADVGFNFNPGKIFGTT